MRALRDLQTAFLRSIATAPGPEASGSFDPALLRVVDGDARQAPGDRLDVYAQMYWMRLHTVLREDYPRVAAMLGDDLFSSVVRAYLTRFPSTHPSVRWVGARFADFLAQCRETAPWPLLPDLARLEWARLAIFDAADAPALRMEDVRAIPASEWPKVVLRPIPALLVLHSPWPIHECWADADGPAPRVRPAETHLRIWRQGDAVYQAPMDPCERRALEAVVSGATFAATCAALETLVGDPERAARDAAQLVLRWVEDEILVRVDARASDVTASREWIAVPVADPGETAKNGAVANSSSRQVRVRLRRLDDRPVRKGG